MSMQTKPWAGGVLAALLYLAAIAWILAAGSGCFTAAHPRRNIDAQYNAAVSIDRVCITKDGFMLSGGSGVIVDAKHVITAGHVATEKGVCSFTATSFDGKKRVMWAKKVMPAVDLAVLEIGVGVSPFVTTPVDIGSYPSVGERVCALHAWPSWGRKCGEVQPYSTTPQADLVFFAVIDHGNSGSGVYDSRGRLVGIVTRLTECSNGQYCGGTASTLEGRVAELLQ